MLYTFPWCQVLRAVQVEVVAPAAIPEAHADLVSPSLARR